MPKSKSRTILAKTPKSLRGWEVAIVDAEKQLEKASPRKRCLLGMSIDWFRRMLDIGEPCPWSGSDSATL